jgi:hypothetical protein
VSLHAKQEIATSQGKKKKIVFRVSFLLTMAIIIFQEWIILSDKNNNRSKVQAAEANSSSDSSHLESFVSYQPFLSGHYVRESAVISSIWSATYV